MKLVKSSTPSVTQTRKWCLETLDVIVKGLQLHILFEIIVVKASMLHVIKQLIGIKEPLSAHDVPILATLKKEGQHQMQAR
mgnify:CR=1 FL=1